MAEKKREKWKVSLEEYEDAFTADQDRESDIVGKRKRKKLRKRERN